MFVVKVMQAVRSMVISHSAYPASVVCIHVNSRINSDAIIFTMLRSFIAACSSYCVCLCVCVCVSD